jgi:hypothetical protein
MQQQRSQNQRSKLAVDEWTAADSSISEKRHPEKHVEKRRESNQDCESRIGCVTFTALLKKNQWKPDQTPPSSCCGVLLR